MMQIGAQGLYISMYDEFNEATQIIPTAEDASMNPAGSSFITWDADGVHCSADFYLRLTGDAGRMFKGQDSISNNTFHSVCVAPGCSPRDKPDRRTRERTSPVDVGSIGASRQLYCQAGQCKRGLYTTVATNIGLLSYTDTGLSNDTAYYYVVRAVNPTGQSPDSAEISATPILVGLKGDYYDNMDFTGFVLSRVDPGVNFDWGNGSPDPSIGVDTFSVRWTGQVVPLFSETYTFFTLSDDG